MVLQRPNGHSDEGDQLLDELEEIEALEEPSATETGARARVSVPPPVPPGARIRASSTPLPPPRSRESSASSEDTTVVRNPGLASQPPSHSGMFRIEREGTVPSAPPVPPSAAGHASLPPPPPAGRASFAPPPPPRSSAPPPPSLASDVTELKRALTSVSNELREHASQIHRLRLTVRLREDRIHELEQLLAKQRERAEEAEAEAQREHARADAAERALQDARVDAKGDDLKRICGIGPGFERALHAAGVTTFLQIADWTPDEVERIAREIRTTPRRIQRDRWIERARELL